MIEADIERLAPRRSQAGVERFATVERLLYKEKLYRRWQSDQEAGASRVGRRDRVDYTGYECRVC